MSYGFGNVSPEGFAALAIELNTGAWGDITLPAARTSLLAYTAPQSWKYRMKLAFDGLAAARSTAALDTLDAQWDRAQRRLDARVTAEENSEKPAHRDAAARVRNALLRGGHTQQTNLPNELEPDFGRDQVQLAKRAPLSHDITLLGLEPILREIDHATTALASALQAQGGAGSPSVRARRALSVCINACNAALDAIDDAGSRPEISESDRKTLVALRAPLASVLDRYTPATSSAPDAPPAAPPPAAAP